MHSLKGSNLGRMSTNHTPTVRWSVGAIGGVACAQAVKVTIGMDGAIPLMGGKDEVRGGHGFHDVIIAIEYGVTRGREKT